LITISKDESIIANTACQAVIAYAAIEDVARAITAVEDIITRFAEECIRAVLALDIIRAVAAIKRIVSVTAC